MLNKIKIEWTKTDNDNVSSKSISEFLTSGLETESSPIARRDGQPEFEFSKLMKLLKIPTHLVFLITQQWSLKMQLFYTKNRVDVWCGTQNGESTAVAASKISGVPLKKIYVHKHHMVEALEEELLIKTLLNKPRRLQCQFLGYL